MDAQKSLNWGRLDRRRAAWLALNVAAAGSFLYVGTQGTLGAGAAGSFHPGLEAAKWALRWLLFCLAMSPLNGYLGWRGAVPLRKPAGLWASAFGGLHLLVYFIDRDFKWFDSLQSPFILLGWLSAVILALLALTSNQRAMRLLGKGWKRLHRWVYAAGLASVGHAVMATNASKLLWMRDPNSLPELQFYLAMMVALLTLRVPQVRAMLLALGRRVAAQQAQPVENWPMPQRSPQREPTRLPEIWLRQAEGAEIAEVEGTEAGGERRPRG